MIWALDSSFDAPTLQQAQQARAAGVGMWWGYLATVQQPGAFNLAAPWSRGAFANVQQAGLRCGAFVSGWDDPAALAQLAQAWGIPLLALDDEDGIRPLSSPDWRPTFLERSGAGLYGLLERQDIPAPFRIAALYPAGGCTTATWPGLLPAPAEPHGWQCQGTHTEFGLSVDRAALDDWFGGEMNEQEHAWLEAIYTTMTTSALPASQSWLDVWAATRKNTDDLKALVAALPGGPAQLQPVLDAIAQLEAQLTRVEKGLQGA